MLPAGILVWTLWMVFMAFFVVMTIIWGIKTGQFKDNEDAKYPMLFDRPLEPWPGREKPKEKDVPKADKEGGADVGKRT